MSDQAGCDRFILFFRLCDDGKLILISLEFIARNIRQILLNLQAAFGEFFGQAVFVIMLQPVIDFPGAISFDDCIFVQSYFSISVFERVLKHEIFFLETKNYFQGWRCTWRFLLFD